MRLYVDFSLLGSDGGPCGAAHLLLRQAGHRPVLEYVSGQRRAELRATTGCEHPPVLVTNRGEVVAGVPRIVDWLASGTELPASAI